MNQFKKIGLIIIGLFLTLDLIGQQKVSQSGFYEGDSVFFEIKDSLIDYTSIEISVNSFSNEFKPYNGGFWLYNRNYTPNTWEDQNFTKYEDYYYKDLIDSLTFVTEPFKRDSLKKVNFVKTRFLDKNGKILLEKIYFIGVNGTDIFEMHQFPVVHLYVDSLEAFGPDGFYGPGKGEILDKWFDISRDIPLLNYIEEERLWNYNLGWSDLRVKRKLKKSRIEKQSFIEIIDIDNKKLLENQKVGARLTGNGNVTYFNKSIQIIAKKKFGSSSLKTELFNTESEEFKNLRLRSGGSGQTKHFGYNELALKLMSGLKIGESKTKIAVLYLNGSYWSLIYVQEKLNEKLIANIYDVNSNQVNLFDVIEGWGTFNLSLYQDSLNFINPLNYCYVPLDSNSTLKYQNWDIQLPHEVDSIVSYINTPEHDNFLLGKIKNGNSTTFLDNSSFFLKALNKPPLKITYNEIDSLIDLKQWLNYICFLDFVGDLDHLQNNIFLANGIGKTKIFAKDFDQSFSINVDENFWQYLYFDDNINYNLAYFIIKDIIIKDEKSIEWIIRVYQDLLNTNLSYKNSSKALEENYPLEFFLEYETYFNSWNGSPNGGVKNANEYKETKNNLDTFLRERPNHVWQILADQWMPEEKFNLNSRNKIKINLEEVPKDCIIVKLNSLEIDSSWQGEYYPKPSLLISVEKNNCIDINDYIWKEYPDSSLTMELFLTKEINLTLVKK